MKETRNDCHHYNAYVTLLLRLTVGLILLTAGVDKIASGVHGFAAYVQTLFKDTFLPQFLLDLFLYTLPFVEITIGTFLLVGLFTPGAFFAAALLLIGLLWGEFLLGKPEAYEVAAHNAIYFLLALLGLRWSEENMLALDGLREKKSESEPPPPPKP